MITRCEQIKPGMTFYLGEHSKVWVVVKKGDYALIDNKKIPICNRKKNKWWCRGKGSNEPLQLLCFPECFSETRYRFSDGFSKPITTVVA